MSVSNNDFLSDYARTLIRVKARQLVRRPEFTSCEVDDLEQELVLHILRKLDQYDSTRGSQNTFIARIVNSAIAMLIRNRRRIKRNGGEGVEIQSLEKMMERPDGAVMPLSASVCHKDRQRRNQSQSLDDFSYLEMQMDVQAVLQKLSPELRKICERLMLDTKSDVQREVGISRRQTQSAIDLIREQFTSSGFHSEQ